MNRPLVSFTLAYVAGIILGRYFSPYLVVFLAVAAVLSACWNIFSGQDRMRVFIPLLLVFLVAGWLAYNYSLHQARGSIRDYSGESCTLLGMVEDEPLWSGDDLVFMLRSQKVLLKGEEHSVSGRVRVTLTWKEKAEMPVDLSYGQKVSLQGKLYEPKGRRNPGGFDYRAFLETRGIAAVFYGPASKLTFLGISGELSRLQLAAFKVRNRMAGVLKAFLPEREGNMLVGMLFGERSALDQETEQLFTRSGISHLLAVSGLHVGLLAGAIFMMARRTGLRGWYAYLFVSLFLFAYVYLCGLKPAAMRALIMVLLVMGAQYWDRPGDFPTALAAAALFTLVYHPLLLFSVSFQLSYAATAAILFLTPLLQEKIAAFLARFALFFTPSQQKIISSLLAVTMAAQLGVIPLTAYYFRQVSLAALLANILILPVMALVLGLGLVSALLGLVWPLAGSLLNLANYPLLSYILFTARMFSALPFSYREVYPPRFTELLLYYLFLAVLAGGWRVLLSAYYRLHLRVKPFYFLVAFLLPALLVTWWGLPGTGSSALEIVFLDVGQGDAIFIRTPQGQNILLDGGGKPAYMGNIDETGRLVVVPFLEYRRVKKLDMVIISHPHEDHYGGLFAVLEKIPVKQLLTTAEFPETQSYAELLELARRKDISREILREGDMFKAGPSLEMRVLSPPSELFSGTNSDSNNNSLVLHLRFKEVSFLFTGDIETRAVECLLEGNKLGPVQILKVPHHGGYLSNLPQFLDSIAPRAAVITVGANPFGHPHPATLAALGDRGVEIYRTDLHGAVILQSDGYSWKVKTMLPF